jgi:hypothetical protein
VERRDPSELLADSDEEEDKGGDGCSEGAPDEDESSIGDSESDEAIDEENSDNIIGHLQAQYVNVIAERADEETEGELDDDQMMAMDDQLAMMFKDRASEKKSKGAPSRVLQVNSFDEHRRGSTERSHTFQEPHHGSSGYFRSKTTNEPVYLAILSTASCPYILRREANFRKGYRTRVAYRQA